MCLIYSSRQRSILTLHFTKTRAETNAHRIKKTRLISNTSNKSLLQSRDREAPTHLVHQPSPNQTKPSIQTPTLPPKPHKRRQTPSLTTPLNRNIPLSHFRTRNPDTLAPALAKRHQRRRQQVLTPRHLYSYLPFPPPPPSSAPPNLKNTILPSRLVSSRLVSSRLPSSRLPSPPLLPSPSLLTNYPLFISIKRRSIAISIINYQLPIINYQLSILNSQLSIINSQFSIIDYQSSIINHQLSIINYQLSIINYQLSIINQLSINYQSIINYQIY